MMMLPRSHVLTVLVIVWIARYNALLLLFLSSGKFWLVSSYINAQAKRRTSSPKLFHGSKQQRTQRQETSPRHSILSPLPPVPSMDTSGLLPPSTYYDTTIHNSTIVVSTSLDHKPTCRMQIAWDILPPQHHMSSFGVERNEITSDDICNMVSNIQYTLDHGLTTFQLKPYSAFSATNQLQYDIYQTLIHQTPKSILEQQSQIVVPLCMDDVLDLTETSLAQKSISSNSVRNHILMLLDRLGIDCLDNIQIQFPDSMNYWDDITAQRGREDATKTNTKNNHLTSILGYNPKKSQYSINDKVRLDDRYYFDLIYELQELVREGYIRSISSKDLTNSMYQHIQANDLHTLFHTNQMDLNLCHVSPHKHAQLQTDQWRNKDSLYIPQHTIAANPLAGGWLADRYYEPQKHLRQKRRTSTWFHSLSTQERWNWDRNIVQSWIPTRLTRPNSVVNCGHDFASVWDIYQTDLIEPLRNIARKHGVSVASVVLRWTLQQHEQTKSTNAACSSTVISCRLLPEHMYWDIHRPFTTVVERVQQIREVLRFALGDDDIEKLWELSSYVEPVHQALFDEHNNYYDDNVEESSNGLFIPKRYGR